MYRQVKHKITENLCHANNAPPPHKQPALLLPTCSRKGTWRTPHPTPIGALYTPNQPANALQDPSLPTKQQVSRCILRPLLSLGYQHRLNHKPQVSSP